MKEKLYWGNPWYGWVLFFLWMAGIAFGIGWKNFLLEFGIRAALIGAVFFIPAAWNFEWKEWLLGDQESYAEKDDRDRE